MLGNVLVSTSSDIVETNMLFCQTSRRISFIRKRRNRQKGVIFSLIVKADDIFVFLEIGTRNIHVTAFTSVIVVFYVYVKEKLREVVVFAYTENRLTEKASYLSLINPEWEPGPRSRNGRGQNHNYKEHVIK